MRGAHIEDVLRNPFLYGDYHLIIFAMLNPIINLIIVIDHYLNWNSLPMGMYIFATSVSLCQLFVHFLVQDPF